MPRPSRSFAPFALSLLLLLFAGSAAAQWRELNPVAALERRPDGVLLSMKPGFLRIRVCTDSIVRVTYSPERTLPAGPDYVIVKNDWPPPKWQLAEAAEEITLTTERLRIVITRSDGSVTFNDLGGRRLVQEASRVLIPVEVNGEKTYRAESFFPVYGSPEGFYGLGQHQAGVWNYRGESVDLSQENTNIAVPLLVSSNGYGILWNNASRSRVNNRFANYLYISSEVADAVDYFFVYGPELDQVIAGYRELTGRVPMFGKWAYGFWQCKNRYKSQDELLSIARKYRELQIPVDNIVQDWFWWNRKGEHVFNKNYPDPAAMIKELHDSNFHVMISVWPFFEPGSAVYDDMEKRGWFVDKFKYAKPPYHTAGMAVYDATNPEARRYYWNLMNKALFSIGVDAWWLDTVEPETEGQQDNILLGHRLAIGSGNRYANIFPLLTTGGVYDGQRGASDRKRVFILARSAFAGAQRYAVTAWSGDVISDWETFKRQIPAALNYAVSGLPYWTSDIGGFTVANPDDSAYRELFVRWFQFGAFSPIFRVHGTRAPDQNELWSYGPEAQRILTSFDRLRYRLLPYIYSVAWKVTSEDYTPMRPLVMDFRADARAQNISDQFMFGPALLVNPVTEPGASTRRVYLPESKWYDFWTGAVNEGGRMIEAAAPLQRLPLYVRAGAIIPMGPDLQYATQKPPDPLELRIYPGADGSFKLYEDENDGYGYERGAHSVIPIRWDDAQRTLTIGAREGEFPGMLAERTFRIVFVGQSHGTGIEVENLPDELVRYSGRAVTVMQRIGQRGSKPSFPPMDEWRRSRIELLMNDFGELLRYRDANAQLQPASTGEQRVVFFGDSITEMWPLEQYFAGQPYVNRGIGGQTTSQMLVRFRQDVVDVHPATVVILAGTNDIAGNTGPMSLDDVEANLASMAELATANHIRVVVSSVLPVHNRTPESLRLFGQRPPEKIRQLNAWLKNYCVAHGYIYLDYFSAMADETGLLKRSLSADGLHPNASGYSIMSPLAAAAIEQSLK